MTVFNRLFLVLLLLFGLSACVESEDSLDAADEAVAEAPAAPPGDAAEDDTTSPPAGDAPADDPAADDPPADDQPADDPAGAPGGGGGGGDDAPPPADDPAIPPLENLDQFSQTLHPVLLDPANSCVNCHGNGQAPEFAVADAQASLDIIAAQNLVNIDLPVDSRLYERPAEDRHFCGDDATCDDIGATILLAIQAWIDEPQNAPPPADEPPPEDEMPPPVEDDAPVEEVDPTDVDVFATTLFPLLRDSANFCVACHGVTQVPTFAVEDVNTAYSQLVSQQRVDLDNPTNSRIYIRPAEDRHNCGGVDSCDRIGADLLVGIQAWADNRIVDENEDAVVVSATTSFADANEVPTVRADDNVIAMFRFEEGTGNVTTDTSGVGTPIPLQLTGTEWVEGGGLRNVSGSARASVADSQRLFTAINASREYSVEAWIVPANNVQEGPARIVSYSESTVVRNFTLGPETIYYAFRNRSTNTGANGTPQLETVDNVVSASLQHVVATFDEQNGRRIYVDGVLRAADNAPDTLEWNDQSIFILGNEVTNDRLWQGVFRLVAVHDSALNANQILQNFEAGLGNLTMLSFDISALLNTPASIDMLFREIDDQAYLFAEPTYVSEAVNIPVRNLRIAVNGSIPVASQAFRRLDMVIQGNGQQLSPLGAVIPSQNGIEQDQFHLEFELLGGNEGAVEGVAPPAPPAPLPDVEEPDQGVRSFSQVNDTFAALTGIDAGTPAVASSYDELIGQLPADTNILSFGVSQQIAIQRLATSYCGEVTRNNGSCQGFFGANCNDAADDATAVANLLYDRFIGIDVDNQPLRADVEPVVTGLFGTLNCANGCDGATATTVLTATCSAVLASGAVLLN